MNNVEIKDILEEKNALVTDTPRRLSNHENGMNMLFQEKAVSSVWKNSGWDTLHRQACESQPFAQFNKLIGSEPSLSDSPHPFLLK